VYCKAPAAGAIRGIRRRLLAIHTGPPFISDLFGFPQRKVFEKMQLRKTGFRSKTKH
jgi:hypothetical protein